MSKKKLDDICEKLLTFFLSNQRDTNNEPIRFNKLIEKLDELGLKASKPTISLHLKHLVEEELITRTEIKPQHIEYSFNEGKWRSMDKHIDNVQKISRIFDNEKEKFSSSSLEDQLGHIYAILTLRNMYVLKSQLLMISEPENEFRHRLDIIRYNHLWNRAIGWLMASYRENEDIQEELIQKIDEFSAVIRNEYFGESLVNVIK